MAVVKQDTELAQIRFSTQILRRLGEELNPSIDQSILELVKNSYDADAKKCNVQLRDITKEGGTIEIVDDGDGMDTNALINGWLVLGESSKSIRKKTKLNRTPAGSKGLGRLAALRMGQTVQVESIPRNNKELKFRLNINWRDYDNAKHVDDVFLPIKATENLQKETQGTTIRITNLKHKVGEREIKKIARGLILLADPFNDDPNSFKPTLKAEEFKEMEELVSRRYFDDAEYHLTASVDKEGNANASVLDYKGNVLFEANHDELTEKRKGRKYECPPTSFDLWAFILNSEAFVSRPTSKREVQDWLGEFGGVHLYENGLRVNPYGNPGNDWLEMNLSRARSPEERPSTNTSIGVVRVNDSDGLLSQKTDRSGFIENDSFHEIRNFCQDSLEWMAQRRLNIAEQRRQKERQRVANELNNSKEDLQKSINKLAPEKKAELQSLFSKYDKDRQQEIKSLRLEVQLYRTLSTAGITAATFSHESRGNPLKVISQSIKAIERRAKQKFSSHYDEIFSKPVQSIIRAINSLAVLGNATLKLLAHEKRRITRVNIHDIIRNVLETFAPFLTGRDINVQTELETGNPYLRASEAAIESILTNLINNSVTALENTNVEDQRILIKTSIQEHFISLSVLDNGGGIKGIGLKDIWLPGQTTNPNGTGLGLTIVRDTVSDLGGNVRALNHGSLGGAELIVELPILGK